MPSAPQALGNHIDAADFTASAERHLGAHVTVNNCHLVFGGPLDDACHVSVSGVVQDLSREFGIRDQPLLGLREGTIAYSIVLDIVSRTML